jgi:hypothetical protein
MNALSIAKVKLGNSFQKCILRVYIMKYSNLGTRNASSIRWSMTVLQLTWCISMLQLSYLMPFLRQKSLAGYNHHPSQQPTLSLSASPWLCFYLSMHHAPLPCMQLLSCHDMPVSHPHCVSCIRWSLAILFKSILLLRDYIMKYSNLGTINGSSIRWSLVASKLEYGRPCCNLLDALACSNLATWCPSWGKSPWLATTTTACSSLPCHCQPLALLLPLHHVPHPCMQLLSCQASCSLPSISSPAPNPNGIPCCIYNPWMCFIAKTSTGVFMLLHYHLWGSKSIIPWEDHKNNWYHLWTWYLPSVSHSDTVTLLAAV